MKSLLTKDIRLWASPLAWIFLSGALMTMLPGYPILVGCFFVCFGVFQSFQSGREQNDTLYSVLLPVRKGDIVRAKYCFTAIIQGLGFLLMAALTVLRMTLLSDATPYRVNAMMNATPFYLACALLIFAAFNVCFLGGFFKTGYNIGIPFLIYGIVTFVIIALGEIAHHLPGLGFLNSPAGERVGVQLAMLLCAAAIYTLTTLLSCRRSVSRFELLDL